VSAGTLDETVTRRRKSLVVLAGRGRFDERGALALVESLGTMGIETVYIGAEQSARRIATTAAEEHVDAIDVCMASGAAGITILRDLLQELERVDRRSVSIVVHRVG
jgi:methylmalonyl-CoA mutase cobalamin-binding domain/chain